MPTSSDCSVLGCVHTPSPVAKNPPTGAIKWATFLVSYDLVGTDSESESHDKLIERIEQYPDSARVQRSTWLIVAKATAKALRDDLKMRMHSSDRLLVVEVKGPLSWSNARCGDEKVIELL